MSDSKSPLICVTCQREFPADLDADNSPRYSAQCGLLPKREDAFEFASEVQNICRYIKAISDVMYFGELHHVEHKTTDTIFELLGQLSDEASRRVDLSLEGYREIEKREIEAEKAAHTRHEGRA